MRARGVRSIALAIIKNKQHNLYGFSLIVDTAPVMFSWLKNDELLEEGVLVNHTLNRVKLSDTGSYTCVVKNDFGSIQHKFHVDVYGK